MKVTNLSSNYDAAVQSQQVDDAIAQKFDMIVDHLCQRPGDRAGADARQGGRHPGRAHRHAAEEGIRGAVHVLRRHRSRRARPPGRRGNGQGTAWPSGKTKAQIVAVTGVAQQLNVQTRIAAFKAVLAKHPGYRARRHRRRQVEHRHEREDHRRIAGALQRARRRRRRVRHGGQPGDRRHPGDRIRGSQGSASPTRASSSSPATA